jgi:hypothetical protein
VNLFTNYDESIHKSYEPIAVRRHCSEWHRHYGLDTIVYDLLCSCDVEFEQRSENDNDNGNNEYQDLDISQISRHEKVKKGTLDNVAMFYYYSPCYLSWLEWFLYFFISCTTIK